MQKIEARNRPTTAHPDGPESGEEEGGDDGYNLDSLKKRLRQNSRGVRESTASKGNQEEKSTFPLYYNIIFRRTT